MADRTLSSLLPADSLSDGVGGVKAAGVADRDVSLGSRLVVSVSGLSEAMLTASECCSSMGRSTRPREEDDEARGAPVEWKGEAEVVLLARRWPRSSRLVFRSSGKRLARVERRLVGGPVFGAGRAVLEMRRTTAGATESEGVNEGAEMAPEAAARWTRGGCCGRGGSKSGSLM